MSNAQDTARELLRQFEALRRAPGTHPTELQQAREAAARWCARAGLDGADLLERIELDVELDRSAPRLPSDAEVDALFPSDAAVEAELEHHARRLGIG